MEKAEALKRTITGWLHCVSGATLTLTKAAF
jgi:hypothetical protein